MNIVYWDKHGDERYRVCEHFASIGIQIDTYYGDSPPENADIYMIHDGPSMSFMPKNLRKKCIIIMTAMPKYHVDNFKSQGFNYAILKNQAHIKYWGKGGLYIRPLCRKAPITTSDGDIVSLIQNYKERAEDNFNFAKQINNIKLYGDGQGQLGLANDREILQSARFLVHIKHLGYLCNSVVKAISQGVPVLTDLKTLEFGYDEILIPNKTCIASDDINILNKAINMPQDQYQYLKNNCIELSNKITNPDISNAKLIYNLIKKIHCEANKI